MASVVCPHCGGTNPPGAAFCQYCGGRIAGSPSTPLPSTPAPSAPSPPAPSGPTWGPSVGGPAGAYQPPPRRRSRLLIVLVVVVVIIIVVAVVSYVFAPAAPTIQISQINFASPDNVCGLAGASAYGFVANTTNVVPLSFDINGTTATNWSGTLPCQIVTLTTTTPGFAITGATVPLTVPANETVVLNFNVVCPGSPYTGPLNLTVT